MLTTLTILSMDQGKIYKDWTLEIVDDTPWHVRSPAVKIILGLKQKAKSFVARNTVKYPTIFEHQPIIQ